MRRNREDGSCVRTAPLGAAVALVLAGVSPALAQTAPDGETPPQAPPAAAGAGGATELAKELSNPVASLVSIPFQLNWDEGLGPDEQGRRFLMNFQPVMPFKLNDDWNLIARVIVPVLAQPVLFEGGQPTSGLGDLLVSGFISPSRGGLTWGVGPVIGLPVSSDPALGSGRYTLGPTAVVLKQAGPWTVGALVNHLWSVGGDPGRKDVNQTFLQPFLAWGRSGWTLSINAESAANWEAEDGQEWTVPINVMVSKVVALGKRPISIQVGPRFYAQQPEGGPKWGFRAALTLIFPAG
jgi:hypothetical protein